MSERSPGTVRQKPHHPESIWVFVIPTSPATRSTSSRPTWASRVSVAPLSLRVIIRVARSRSRSVSSTSASWACRSTVVSTNTLMVL